MGENLQITKQHKGNECNRKIRHNVRLLIVHQSIKSIIANETDFIFKVQVISEPSPGQDSARDEIQVSV